MNCRKAKSLVTGSIYDLVVYHQMTAWDLGHGERKLQRGMRDFLRKRKYSTS